ncbi:hypothetical protein F0L68_28735 [Solihabitans fulvus]|uniref:Secreted protein n=1 Tax=Solihabitans fulvus TaxID=1892852 RepID=A0A5B2WTY9_9PSEU|nr:hypothetical protein [Solihabitans fulvus]KAA2255211.1 hypothetical protein F0L68_28735 [Solihabitans fulvus]
MTATLNRPSAPTTPTDQRTTGLLASVRRLLFRWRTPSVLRALTGVILVLAVAWGVVVGGAFGGVRDGLSVIGHQAAPQVAASADLRFALSDLDAQVANVLLVGTDAEFAGNRRQALDTYEKRRVQVDADVQQVAANGGADPSTQRSIRTVLDDLGRYEALAGEALLLNENSHDPVGRPGAKTLDLYRQATGVMAHALKAAQELTNANHRILGDAYAVSHGDTSWSQSLVMLLGILVCGALVLLQLYLRWRLRRLVNPAVAVATLLVACLTVAAIVLLVNEQDKLKVAKKDAFDSVVALSEARALSYDANADESRYLLDQDHAADYERAFHEKAEQIATLPGVNDLGQYVQALDDAAARYQRDPRDVRFDGLFGTEVRNVTFDGEQAAAEHLLAAYSTYQRDDQGLRSLSRSGQLRQAVAFDVGTTSGTSNYDFGRYDEALQSVIAINKQAFDTALSEGEAALSGWTWLIPGLAVLVMLALVVLGVRPRLAEYR